MVWMQARIVAVAVLVVLQTGCGVGDSNARPTAPVTVTVTYKGKPVDGAIVQFISVENPQPAVGTTDSAGVCKLTTYNSNDGAIVGSNVITISKNEIDSKNIKPVRPEDKDLVGITPPPNLKSLIPQKYSFPGSSGLKEEVKNGKNAFTFDLKD